MAISAYPFDTQNISEAQFGALQGSGLSSGIIGAPTSDNFKVTATGASMVLTLTPVGGNSLALVRGHLCVMTTGTTVTVAAASVAARVDLVVLRLDYASNVIVPVVLKGTSGSQIAPSPSWGAGGFYELPVARVAVGGAAATLSQGNVTDIRRFAGPTPGSWPTVNRPDTPNTIGYNTSESRWEYTLDGAAWLPLNAADLGSDNFAGILPIAKGGTGTTTALAALQALGIYVQSAAPAYADNRVWIKVP